MHVLITGFPLIMHQECQSNQIMPVFAPTIWPEIIMFTSTTAAAASAITANKNYHLLLLFLLLLCESTLICPHPICKPQVPVANGTGSYPFSVDVPRNTRFLFSNKTATPAKAIAKSIVRPLYCGIHFTLFMNCSMVP